MKSAPLFASLAAVFAASAWAAPVQLRVLETSDVHMNLLAYDYYQDKPAADFGLERTASLIAAARAESPNSLLIDNGDLLQGSPMGDLVAKIKPLKAGDTHPAYKVLNALKYDAGNLGNHEFNYGLPFLQQSLKGAAFPYVNANVLDARSGQPLFTPYVLLKREVKDAEGKAHALTIGVIGFAPPQILQWDKNTLQGKATVRDILETARDYVPKMRAAGADLVIAVPHSGFEKGELPRFAENAVSGLAEVPGIDAILFGHAHAEFPSTAFAGYPGVDLQAGTIHGVPAAMPGRWGDHLGVIDLTLEQAEGKWRVVGKRATLRPIFDKQAKKPLADIDPRVKALIGPEHQATLDYVRGEVAATRRPIYSYFAQAADDPSVAIVAEAQRCYMQKALQGTEYEHLPILSAAAPFKAGGRQGWNYYTDIPAGKLAIRNLADLYIYPNTIKAVKVTGADVREWLEMSAGQFNRIDPKGPAAQELINPAFRSYNFDSLYGVSYQVDVTQPARYDGDGKLAAPGSHRIVNLTFNGKPIDPAQRFIVVTNNYRASGGGNFPGISADKIVVDAPDENRAALASYLASKKVIDLGQGRNWRVLPVAGVGLRFTTGAGAMRYLPEQKQFKLARDNGDGSVTLELAE
ncbi:bifunctional 2',3'-cyclic-nucleotide 2'-phosphodiesterase/3'-nucleotidase [Chromobacterium vaccinii]|uniref:2',3'-cyclic-nucleotide 2'-phosphodiesterase n=1 Tax=Chromobacterium vaccinii TaxID=1108595 RepID=A0A1D9LI97_9NEIS|nr:bifunctional 2',3'-cyclic-nucleotide 2'-phosphodiesterase/3'-nucleotidase [Chromobacterium vaccinii]AOZ50982.1 2',3'-cyclic-nucleotide 2'-phosphodiesterase [Chromobacterium vaccinii]